MFQKIISYSSLQSDMLCHLYDIQGGAKKVAL